MSQCETCLNAGDEDFFTGEDEIPPEHLIKLTVGQACFCYNAIGLYEWVLTKLNLEPPQLPTDPKNPSWVYDPYQMYLIKMAKDGNLAEAGDRNNPEVQHIRQQLLDRGFRDVDIPDHGANIQGHGWMDRVGSAFRTARQVGGPLARRAGEYLATQGMSAGRRTADAFRRVGAPMARRAARAVGSYSLDRVEDLVEMLRQYTDDQMQADFDVALNAQERAELEQELQSLLEQRDARSGDLDACKQDLDACKARSDAAEAESIALRQEIKELSDELRKCVQNKSSVRQSSARVDASKTVQSQIATIVSIMDTAFDYARHLVSVPDFNVRDARMFTQALSQAIQALPHHPQDNPDALQMSLETRDGIRNTLESIFGEAQMRVFRIREWTPPPNEVNAWSTKLDSTITAMQGALRM